MNGKSYLVLTCLLLWAGSCSIVTGGEFISSWKQLDKDLLAEIEGRPSEVTKDVYFSWEYLKDFKTSQRIEKLGPSVWFELTKQPDVGLVKLVAYHFIAAKSPQHTTDAALAIALSSPAIIRATERSGPGAHLRNLESTPEAFRSFSVIMSTQYNLSHRTNYNLSQRTNFVLTIGMIRVGFLADWLKGQHALPILVTNEAQVVDHLLGPKRELPNDVRMLLRQKLNGYAPVPGIARLIFLRHGVPDENQVFEITKLELTNSEIMDAELILALEPHYEVIRNRFDELSEVKGELAKKRLSRLRTELDRQP